MIIPGQQTLGNLFQSAGYRTLFVGKMHNGGAFWNIAGSGYASEHTEVDFSRPFDRGPTQFGFDRSFVLPAGISGEPYAFFRDDRLVRYSGASDSFVPFDSAALAQSAFSFFDKTNNDLGSRLGESGFVIDNYDSRNVGPSMTKVAIELVREAVRSNDSLSTPSPFFLYFATPELHVPWTPPDFFNLSDPQNITDDLDGIPILGETPISRRTDMVYQIDVMLGAVVAELESLGVLDDTLIVVTSDNGANAVDFQSDYEGVGERRESRRLRTAVHFNAQGIENGVPLRGAKAQIFEGGHRVPLVMSWGEGNTDSNWFRENAASTDIVGLNDLAATFASILGVDISNDPLNYLDSRSILSDATFLSPGSVSPPRSSLIVQGLPVGSDLDRAFYKRDAGGDLWKLIVRSDVDEATELLSWVALFNLTDDPGETADLFGSPDAAGVLADMQADYAQLILQSSTVR
jgi:arylsulfatase A-like enzyme